MQQYLTISEFAALRNVNINSIRYYEQQNILIPAYIDPKTKYRYYLPEQLVLLDIITLCIKLGMPLKELKTHINENGVLDKKAILENGKKAMEAKITAMQLGVEITEYSLRSMEQNQQYVDQKDVYTRQIEERYLLVEPFSGTWADLEKKEKMATQLFHDAQNKGMAPVFPAGMMIHYDTNPITYSLFVQILHPLPTEKEILHIPQADFSCLQVAYASQKDVLEIVDEKFSTMEKSMVIMSNLILNGLHCNNRCIEIQIAL